MARTAEVSRVDALRAQREADYAEQQARRKAVARPIAERINEAHEAVGASMRATLERAKAVGDLLHEAKGEVKHGGWAAWVEAHCRFSARTAQKYMQVSADWATISKAPFGADLGLNDTLAAIAAPKPERPKAAPAADPEPAETPPMSEPEDVPAASEPCPHCGGTGRA